MLSDFSLKQGDTAYIAEYVLPVIPDNKTLDTAAIMFRYGLRGGSTAYQVSGEVVDSSTGTVSASFHPAVAGTYNCEFVVTWADSSVSIYPREDYLITEVWKPLSSSGAPADIPVGTPPSTPTATGYPGQAVATDEYLYVCVGVNQWVRFAADSTWS